MSFWVKIRFMNKWNIPKDLELEVRKRDQKCIYCGVAFTDKKINKKHSATWEHIINDAKIININNIALCCCSCNASKGSKTLKNWMQSNYCQQKNIKYETVALVVKRALDC